MVAWTTASVVLDVAAVPSPTAVSRALAQDASQLLAAVSRTAIQAVVGLAIGATGTAALLLLRGLRRGSESYFYPLLVLLKATPAVAFAPVLILAFGAGLTARAMIAALIAFLPMAISALDSQRAVPRDLLLMSASYGASSFREFRHLEAPYIASGFLSGLKTGCPLAVIGAIVGDWVVGGTSTGIGARILTDYFNSNFAGLYAANLVAALLGLTLFGASHIAWLNVSGRLLGAQTAPE